MGPANKHFKTVIYWAVGVLLLAACSSTAVTPNVPTATLIPSTATPVPITPPPTETARPGIRASQLNTEIPPAIATFVDPIQQDLVAAVLADVAALSGFEPGDIDLSLVADAQWPSATLFGCPQTSGEADVAGYRMLLVAGAMVYEYHTDTLDAFRLCGRTPITDVTDETLLAVDPIASDVFAIAQRRLGERFDIPTRRVRLVEMQTIVWPDASLGCPLDGETYGAVEIDGYRLVVTVADDIYIFHAAFDRLIECAAEDVVLPTELPEVTPEATAEATADATIGEPVP